MPDGEALSTDGFVSVEQDRPEPGAEQKPAEAALAEEEVAPKDGEAAEGAEAADVEEQDQPKPRKTAQERIDEITRARREAERDAKYWRDVAEGRVKPRQQEREAEEAKAPDPGDFDMGETDPGYIKAVIAYEVKKGLDEGRQVMAQDLHLQAAERVWEASQESARSKYDDYDEKVIEGASDWPCTREMAEAIRTSDAGGEIAYHLASNPEEARRIASLDPISQIRALGRLEARLESPADTKPKPKTATDAPKPPENQARGAGGKFSVAPDTDDFAAFEKAFPVN